MTGTIAVFGYATGQYFTTVEEIEPFGQKVATADPEYFEPTIETGSTTFGWMIKHRRISKDYEASPETSEAMIYVAMIRLMLVRLDV